MIADDSQMIRSANRRTLVVASLFAAAVTTSTALPTAVASPSQTQGAPPQTPLTADATSQAFAAASVRPNSANLRVERLYWAYFRRAPGGAGQNYWIGQVLQGRPLSVVSEDFARSAEFIQTYGSLSDQDFVERIYENVLDRQPETSGLTFWADELSSGRRTRGEVMVGFSESPEFVLNLGHLDGEQVKRLYRAFFLRNADQAGLKYWYGQQISGMALAEIAEFFVRDSEFRNRYGELSERDFVHLVYQNVLEREPDVAGWSFWTDQLTSGKITRGQMMVGFSEGPEFSGNPVQATGTQIGGCSLFPADSFWYSSVADLPVLASSNSYVNRLGADNNALADFGSGLWDGSPIGIPFAVVDASAPDVPVTFDYEDESDAGPYPVPGNTPIEGGGDRHALLVDSSTCVLHELYAVEWQSNGSIHAGSGARWDLGSNSMRPEGWTSGDAAGLPILPGLVRYDEVAAGSIDHAIRFTANVTDDSYVWPASHAAGSNGSNRPPMGSWMRLKASVNANDFTGQAKVVVLALQEHGAILADNGSSWYLSGAPDDRWDNDDLRQLRDLEGSMFEFVDASSLQVGANSYAAQ